MAESGVDRDLLLDYIYVRDQATGEIQRTTGADTGFFEILAIDASSNLINGIGFITAQIQDQDRP